MSHIIPMSASAPPMPAVARILSRYDREVLASFIAVAIDLLDTLDGPDDPDAPDFTPRSDGGPGDPGDDFSKEDEEAGAYAEWTSLEPAQRRQGDCLIAPGRHEDDELEGDETDGNGTEDEECAWFKGPHLAAGCPVADPGGSDCPDD
jgi:hypothetical protein